MGATVWVVSAHSPRVCVHFSLVFCFPPTPGAVPVRICLIPVRASAGVHVSVPHDGGTSCPGEVPPLCPELPAWAPSASTLTQNKWVDK